MLRSVLRIENREKTRGDNEAAEAARHRASTCCVPPPNDCLLNADCHMLYNEKWFPAKVVEVDGSLLRVHYQGATLHFKRPPQIETDSSKHTSVCRLERTL